MSEGNTITLYPYTESSLSRRIKEKQRREMMAMDKQDEEEKLVIAKVSARKGRGAKRREEKVVKYANMQYVRGA